FRRFWAEDTHRGVRGRRVERRQAILWPRRHLIRIPWVTIDVGGEAGQHSDEWMTIPNLLTERSEALLRS
ncbi:hypothetical protein EBU58_11295, partial [bacterium]|nr:hypothetical protein [bacterium]